MMARGALLLLCLVAGAVASSPSGVRDTKAARSARREAQQESSGAQDAIAEIRKRKIAKKAEAAKVALGNAEAARHPLQAQWPQREAEKKANQQSVVEKEAFAAKMKQDAAEMHSALKVSEEEAAKPHVPEVEVAMPLPEKVSTTTRPPTAEEKAQAVQLHIEAEHAEEAKVKATEQAQTQASKEQAVEAKSGAIKQAVSEEAKADKEAEEQKSQAAEATSDQGKAIDAVTEAAAAHEEATKALSADAEAIVNKAAAAKSQEEKAAAAQPEGALQKKVEHAAEEAAAIHEEAKELAKEAKKDQKVVTASELHSEASSLKEVAQDENSEASMEKTNESQKKEQKESEQEIEMVKKLRGSIPVLHEEVDVPARKPAAVFKAHAKQDSAHTKAQHHKKSIQEIRDEAAASAVSADAATEAHMQGAAEKMLEEARAARAAADAAAKGGHHRRH